MLIFFLSNDPVVLSDHWVGCRVSYKLSSVCIAEPLGINFIGATMKLFFPAETNTVCVYNGQL